MSDSDIKTDPVALGREVRRILSDPAMWHQGGYTPDPDDYRAVLDPSVPCCLYGALFRASGINPGNTIPVISWPAYRSFESNLRAVVEDTTDHTEVADFNDDPDTTHRDVLSVIDKAIALAAKADPA